MFRGGGLRNKQVINAQNAQRIGYVYDIEIDEENGIIMSIIVTKGGFFRRLFNIGEIIVPWNSISAVSEEYILVDMLRIME